MIGQFIKQKRENAGMTQQDLYEHLPTKRERATSKYPGRSTISKIESGSNILRLDQLYGIAKAFGMTGAEFLDEFERWEWEQGKEPFLNLQTGQKFILNDTIYEKIEPVYSGKTLRGNFRNVETGILARGNPGLVEVVD